jgi:hypothetical protein
MLMAIDLLELYPFTYVRIIVANVSEGPDAVSNVLGIKPYLAKIVTVV